VATNSSERNEWTRRALCAFEEEKGTYQHAMLTLFDHACSKTNVHPARLMCNFLPPALGITRTEQSHRLTHAELLGGEAA
jgi:hypothetical protein